MTFQLRPYQSAATDAALAFLRQSVDPILIDAAPAAGKSFMIAHLAHALHDMSGGKCVLCLAPNQELVKQNFEKYLLTGEYASIFSASAGHKSTRHFVVFGTPGTVKNSISRFTRQGKDGYCAVVVDECFTGETLIMTPRGEVPIKSLRNGDIVCNAMGNGNVVTTFAKSVSELYEVILSNGKTIRCTGNHPFFTARGWISADSLMEGEITFRQQDVSDLLEGIWTETGSNEKEGWNTTRDEKPDSRSKLEQSIHLLAILREEVEEPHALGCIAIKNGRDTISDRTQAYDEGRERAWANRTAIGAGERTGRRLDYGVGGQDRHGEVRLSQPLQDRYSQSRDDDSDRSGWDEPSRPCSAGTGPAENGTTNQVRVESVSRVELGSPETVYNLHVSGHPSYYAGGALVHNCHGLTPTIKAIIDEMREANPMLRVIGLTGTPFRLGTGYIFRLWPDGKANGDDTTRDPYFLKCVYRVSAKEMLDEKFITPMEIGAINEAYDTSDIELLPNGTLNHETVERAFEGHGRKTAAIVADVIAKANQRPGGRGVMYFAATVRHAYEVLASLPPDNSALVIGGNGETCILNGKQTTRNKVIEAYRAGKVRHLVSVGTLTTGFDVAHTEIIALLRFTESASLLQQILGRAWRLCEGKDTSLLLDYAGNVEKHFPDGDIYNPEIRAKGGGGPGVPIEAECPDCGYVNEFSLQPDYADYQRDKHGYCLDVFGEQLMGDFGPIPAHYGRRCFGMVKHGPKGEYKRCNYRWNGKDCDACGEVNDIAARFCYVCKAEIVDPNEKLIAEFKTRKRDPYQPQTERIVSLTTNESVSQRGNRTLRVDFVTEYRQFSIWLMPEPTNNKAASQWHKWEETGGEPKTVSYVKEADSQFYRVLAYNRPADEEDLPEVVMKETEKLRRYAA